MKLSRRTRILLIQGAVLCGMVVYFKVALPQIQKAREASRIEELEKSIQSFFDSTTEEVGSADGARRALRLRRTPDVQEVQNQLGAPKFNMTDFTGAQHFTWVGTQNKLTASFNKGRLYALTLSDLAEQHGQRVYETSTMWQKF